MNKSVLTACLMTVLACVSSGAGGAAPDDSGVAAAGRVDETQMVILDHTAYWRSYYVCRPVRISPHALAAEGEKLLGAAAIERLKAQAEKRLKAERAEGADWTQSVPRKLPLGDGRSVAFYAGIADRVSTTPPPREWTQPQFDDGDWTRQREPLLLGRPGWGKWKCDLAHVQRAFFRTTFQVKDPSRPSRLRLKLAYAGGARAFVNGREIARGHLPQGDLAPDDDLGGDIYPAEAYTPPEGEYRPPRLPASCQYMMPDLLRPFEDLPVSKADGQYRVADSHGPQESGIHLTRTGWERLTSARRRESEADIPDKLLRQGTNVLALEMRASPYHPVQLRMHNDPWAQNGSPFTHNRIWGCQLRGDAANVVGGLERPTGTQVWVEDIHHRLYSPEFCPPGETAKTARIIGARNGTYAVQVVVGTDRDLAGLRATCGQFKSPSGAALPQSCPQILYGVPSPMSFMGFLGQDYKGPTGAKEIDEYNAILERHGGFGGHAPSKKEREAALRSIQFFDHLTPTPPAEVPASTCQPIWLSVRIPESAAPGTYRAALTVSAEDLPAVSVPVEIEVFDWRMPDPIHFRTAMGMEQSPYAVAKHYKVPLWSDEHFRLMESSFRWLGSAGNDWLIVPVLAHTEFGNGEDSPIRITRKRDGSFAFDFAVLDRYLAMARRHWGAPRVVNFIVNQPGGLGSNPYPPPLELPVLDEASGQTTLWQMGWSTPSSPERALWKALATSLHAHMQSLGLGKSMFWGLPWDTVGDESLPAVLAEYAPDVPWTRQSHNWRPDDRYTAVSTLFGFDLGLDSRQGWRRQDIHMLFPRNQGDVLTCWGPAPPFVHRLIIDRVLVAGGNGVARLAGDFWDNTWMEGFKGRLWCPGIASLMLLWPGADGAETGQRFEVLREGLQEGELRIFLEQASGRLGESDLATRINETLQRHSHDTMLMEPRSPYVKQSEHSTGWQVRSRKLLELAAQTAAAAPLALDADRLALRLPARGESEVVLKLWNWTAAPRGWKVATDQAWLTPKSPEARARPGLGEITLQVDGDKLEVGKEAEARVVLTDAASGSFCAMAVAVTPEKALRVSLPNRVFNVEVGGKAIQTALLVNRSNVALPWQVAASAPWLTAVPAGGTLPPLGRCEVAMTAVPAEKERARLEADLTVTERGGKPETVPLVIHVIPPYRAPAGRPAGAEVRPADLPKDKVKGGARGLRFFPADAKTPAASPKIGLAGKEFASVIQCGQPCDLVYNIAGMGLSAFAAEVGMEHGFCAPYKGERVKHLRLHFEVYVDGQCRAQSGLMSATDPPRLLTVAGLQEAKEVRLKVRLHDDTPLGPHWPKNEPMIACWGHPVFYMTRDVKDR